MQPTKPSDDPIAEFQALSPELFPRVRSFTVVEGEPYLGEHEVVARLVLSPLKEDNTNRLYVEFHGVRVLRFSQPTLSVVQMSERLQIERLPGPFLEGPRFRAFEPNHAGSDDPVLDLRCRDVYAWRTDGPT